MTALIVAYARPFTKSRIEPKAKSIDALHDAPPPNDPTLLEQHELLIEFRHKFAGHKDALPGKELDVCLNRVVIDRDRDGFAIHTIVFDGMDQIVGSQLKLLCSHYIDHCNSRLQGFNKKYGSEILKLALGRYELRLIEAPEAWIVPSQVKAQ